METNKITLLGENYIVEDVIDTITISDSFVARQNKIGTGNGEAKLYIGSRNNSQYSSFFKEGPMNGFLLKRDMLEYLLDARFEYENQEQAYRKNISDYWLDNKKSFEEKADTLMFEFNESSSQSCNRYYITSSKDDIFYKEFRKSVLPEITYLSILKIRNSNDEIIYYFRPYLNYFYDSRHHTSIINAQETEIDQRNIDPNDKKEIKSSRKGQGKYRLAVINEMGECLITKVNDERILVASHIKPWSISTDEERIDKYNGLLLTPTYDKLFDQGFITFSNDGCVLVSPYISPLNLKRLGLINGKKYELPSNAKRSAYLDYHRKEIFKGAQ